jgi:hypothetical protein
LIREYQQNLICEAVTGKIIVSEEVKVKIQVDTTDVDKVA